MPECLYYSRKKFLYKKLFCPTVKALKNLRYFGGIYEGTKGNEELWRSVKMYIEDIFYKVVENEL